MDARICSNLTCRCILPHHKCSLCGAFTSPLPHISLALIGVNGTAHLVHNPDHGYAIAVNTQSGPYDLQISLSDLLQDVQIQLPHINPASGLQIMDALSKAALLMQSKNTGQWSGWIIYLLELLQTQAHHTAFQDFLKDLSGDLNATLLRDDQTLPIHDITEDLEVQWPGK